MDNKFLSTEDTKILKGCAVLLMLTHHLFMSSDRIVEGLSPISTVLFDDVTVAMYIGFFGKICVSIFMFLGGYGTYKAFNSGKLDILQKIKRLYIAYWKVFIIFVPVGFIFFRNQTLYAADEIICNVFNKFDFREFIANFAGFWCSYNREWWFFVSYLIAMMTFPLTEYLMRKMNRWCYLALIVVSSIVFNNIVPFISSGIPSLQNDRLYSYFIAQTPYITCFWLGCIMAKDDLMNKLQNKMCQLCHLNILVDIIWIVVCIVLRNSVLDSGFDLLIVPVFCVVVSDLIARLRLQKLFMAFGKNSTNIWLIHSFFCYYFYPVAKLVYASRYAILVFMVEVILSFVAARIVDLFKLYPLSRTF